MKAKITLSIDEEKINKFKTYAQETGIIVSEFLEQRIDVLPAISPSKKLDVSILPGAFGKELKNFDWKKIKTEHLMKKYGL